MRSFSVSEFSLASSAAQAEPAMNARATVAQTVDLKVVFIVVVLPSSSKVVGAAIGADGFRRRQR